ncbi:MAG: hypothetical protein DMD93_07390 [Candidatus Rokuibacteriota bacterium]|nr:MAG: hypothetical protein DMD93_07390 [Candidatus Rokubacteria bacterium]
MPLDSVEREVPRQALVRASIHGVAAEKIPLRPRELLGRDGVATNPLDFREERRFSLRRVLGRRAEIEHERSGLTHGVVVGGRGIGEALLVTQLGEEPSGHAAAEDRREHLHGGVVRMVEGRREGARQDLGLLSRHLELDPPGGRDRRGDGRVHAGAVSRHTAEAALGLGEHLGGRDLAADRQHHPVGSVARAIGGDNRGVIDTRERLGGPQDGQGVRVRAVERRVERVEGA